MWDNAAALTRLTRLILLATLCFAVWNIGRVALEAAFPFRQVTVLGAHHTDTKVAAEGLIRRFSGGFFSINLKQVHHDFEALPWVRQAQVRRVWPGGLVIELNEHRPAAAWNDRATLNTHGDTFPVSPWTGLPRIYAPEGMQREIARHYGEFAELVKPLDLRIEQIVVSARLSWRVRLGTGHPGLNSVSVELGRDRLSERLARFTRFYPQALAAVGPLHRVDMRYPNGFAGEPQRTGNQKNVLKQAKPA
jgi:cell division protein FtsQ